jgi:hypothetical protein
MLIGSRGTTGAAGDPAHRDELGAYDEPWADAGVALPGRSVRPGARAGRDRQSARCGGGRAWPRHLRFDDIDWDDEVRVFLEERTSFSPDCLTGMEADLRFVGPETMESKIFRA